jgi:hypothetical protein
VSVLVGLVLLLGTAAGRAQQATNPKAAALVEFSKRVQEYLDTRQKAVSQFEPLKQDADQATISAREKALGEAIRTARAGAKKGDVLSPAVEPIFRAATKADFRRRSTHGKKLRLDELPHFQPVVNQTYPSAWPLQTFPPTLLRELPKLPPELEYRFVDNALLLRDTKANIVVDYLLDVM